MQSIHREQIVAHAPEVLYGLVNDVARYAEFVPHCSESVVLDASDNHMVGALTFSLGGVSKTVTTRNTLSPHSSISVQLEDGPFQHLSGEWHFEVLPNGQTRVSLDFEFEFQAGLLGKLFSPVFEQVLDQLVAVFCRRADTLVGS